MSRPQYKSYAGESIEINYRPDTTSELLSSASCGCPDTTCNEPAFNANETLTTSLSNVGISDNGVAQEGSITESDIIYHNDTLPIADYTNALHNGLLTNGSKGEFVLITAP